MGENFLIIYIICAILAIDYYDGYIPPHKKIAPLFINNKMKSIFYVYYCALKRQWFPYCLFFCIGLIFMIFNPSFVLFLFFIIFVSLIAPILSYYNFFSIFRYLIYIIPIVFLFFELSFLMYIYFCGVVISSLMYIKKLHINPYATHKKNRGRIKGIKRLIYPIIIVLSFLFLNNIESFKKIPFEEGIIFILLYLMTQIEMNITENKMLLLTYKARGYLSIIKTSSCDFKIFSQSQISKIISNLDIIITLLVCLGFHNNHIIDYVILLLGAIVIVLSSFDLFLYHYILQKSLVYANTVVRNLITLIVNALIFQFVVYYSVIKIYSNQQLSKNLTVLFRGGFLCVFIILIYIYIYRYKSIFKMIPYQNEE